MKKIFVIVSLLGIFFTLSSAESQVTNQKFTLKLQSGWNAISIPVKEGLAYPVIIPICNSAPDAFYWDAETSSYKKENKLLEPRKGYWIFTKQDCSIEVSGTPLTENPSRQKIEKWQFVGALGKAQTVDSLKGNCEKTGLNVYSYDTNYKFPVGEPVKPDESAKAFKPVTTIEPTKAYWVKNTKDCTFNARKPPCGSYGDLNRDGFIAHDDATEIVTSYLLQVPLSGGKKNDADLNGDGQVSKNDATAIVDYAEGNIDTFTICSLKPPREDKDDPEIISTGIAPSEAGIGTIFTITSKIVDYSPISNVRAVINYENSEVSEITLYDDGAHGDVSSGDKIYGNTWDSTGQLVGNYYIDIEAKDILNNIQKVENIIQFSISASKCIEVVKNGDTADKIDVVLVPDGYTQAELGKFASSIVPAHIGTLSGSKGILSREPFLSNQDKFNFYYVRESNNFNCKDYFFCPMFRVIKTVAAHCPFFDEIIVIVNTDKHFGYAFTGLGFAVSPGGPLKTLLTTAEKTTSHEFGHSFGGLKDEYIDPFPESPTTYPNCDVYGCPKWCTGTPAKKEPPWQECSLVTDDNICENKPNCRWHTWECVLSDSVYGDFSEGLSCIDDAVCYHNCHGTNGFRSSFNSIMAGSRFDWFNTVSKKHLNNIFRCCYPQTNDEFDTDLCTEWSSDNSDRYSSCTTIK